MPLPEITEPSMEYSIGSLREKFNEFRLTDLAREVRRQNLTYLSSSKLLRLERALRSAGVRRTRGCFIEFGVALGGSAILIASAAKGKCKFLGFDVFGLIPEPSSEKDDEVSRSRYKDIKGGTSRGIGGETYYGYRADLFGDVVSAFERNGLSVDGNEV